MEFHLVKIFAAIFCLAQVAKSENTFQLRQERSLNSEKDFKSAVDQHLIYAACSSKRILEQIDLKRDSVGIKGTVVTVVPYHESWEKVYCLLLYESSLLVFYGKGVFMFNLDTQVSSTVIPQSLGYIPRYGYVYKEGFLFSLRRERSLTSEKEFKSTGRNRRELIGVTVQLSFTDFENEDVIPALNVTAAQETTAFEFLQLAAQQNPCYLFEYLTHATVGHYITTICCVTQNLTSNFSWFVYINNALSPVGVDFLKPNNGDVLKFEYRFINSTDDNHTETSQAGKQDANETMISVSVKLAFTNYPDPNILPPEQVVAPNGTVAFEFLQLAAQINPCYIFNYTVFSIGSYITTICCVEQNTTTNFYWLIYLNGQLSPVGADLLKPKNGDTLTYEYRKWDSSITNHTSPTNTPQQTKPKPNAIFTSTTPQSSTPTANGQKIFPEILHIFVGMAIGILAWKHLEVA